MFMKKQVQGKSYKTSLIAALLAALLAGFTGCPNSLTASKTLPGTGGGETEEPVMTPAQLRTALQSESEEPIIIGKSTLEVDITANIKITGNKTLQIASGSAVVIKAELSVPGTLTFEGDDGSGLATLRVENAGRIVNAGDGDPVIHIKGNVSVVFGTDSNNNFLLNDSLIKDTHPLGLFEWASGSWIPTGGKRAESLIDLLSGAATFFTLKDRVDLDASLNDWPSNYTVSSDGEAKTLTLMISPEIPRLILAPGAKLTLAGPGKLTVLGDITLGQGSELTVDSTLEVGTQPAASANPAGRLAAGSRASVLASASKITVGVGGSFYDNAFPDWTSSGIFEFHEGSRIYRKEKLIISSTADSPPIKFLSGTGTGTITFDTKGVTLTGKAEADRAGADEIFRPGKSCIIDGDLTFKMGASYELADNVQITINGNLTLDGELGAELIMANSKITVAGTGKLDVGEANVSGGEVVVEGDGTSDVKFEIPYTLAIAGGSSLIKLGTGSNIIRCIDDETDPSKVKLVVDGNKAKIAFTDFSRSGLGLEFVKKTSWGDLSTITTTAVINGKANDTGVASPFSAFDQFELVGNAVGGSDTFLEKITNIRLDCDLSNTAGYELQVANYSNTRKVIIDGNNKSIKFGLSFKDATDVTIKNLNVEISENGKMIADPVTDELAGIIFAGGSGNTLQNVTVTITNGVASNSGKALYGVKIDPDIAGKVTITGGKIINHGTIPAPAESFYGLWTGNFASTTLNGTTFEASGTGATTQYVALAISSATVVPPSAANISRLKFTGTYTGDNYTVLLGLPMNNTVYAGANSPTSSSAPISLDTFFTAKTIALLNAVKDTTASATTRIHLSTLAPAPAAPGNSATLTSYGTIWTCQEYKGSSPGP
jgi:hypothetical protein